MPPSTKKRIYKCVCGHVRKQHTRKGICTELNCNCSEYLGRHPRRVYNLLSQNGKVNRLAQSLAKRGKLDEEFSKYIHRAIEDAAMPFLMDEWNSNNWIQNMVSLQHERVCNTIVKVLTGGKRG